MKLLSMFLGAVLAVSASAGDITPVRVQAYLCNNGVTEFDSLFNTGAVVVSVIKGVGSITHWAVPNVAKPTDADMPVAVDAAAIVEAARQAAKPLERKQTENQYFQLCTQVLALAGDPRATNTVPPRLSFQELTAMLEIGQQTNPTAAVVLSVRLLSVNALLQRYSLLWWETAAWHPDIVQ